MFVLQSINKTNVSRKSVKKIKNLTKAGASEHALDVAHFCVIIKNVKGTEARLKPERTKENIVLLHRAPDVDF